jgi:DNA-binding SARP family transcriptional activator
MFDTCMKSLAVRVLGEFGVDGVEARALGSRKARLALHLLALGDGQPVPADVLVDALWGDAPPARPDDQLAVLMSRLRSVLGRDRIEHREGGYLLRADWRDATELAQLTEEIDRRQNACNAVGAAAAARVALSLLRGAEPAQPPGEWALLRRTTLDRLIARARLTASAALLAAGAWVAAVDCAAAALERDPYEEAALRTLMRAYAAGGQPAAALSAHASARKRLAEDLGTDPSAETDELHTAILRGEVRAIKATAASQAGPVSLVGRADELAFLDACAARSAAGATEVVVAYGEPGIGKTSLLRAWSARRHAAAGGR